MEWSPEEIAMMDAAFNAGVKEATKRHSSLLFFSAAVNTRFGKVWMCAYPPADIQPPAVGKWARANGIVLNDGDRFLSRAEVRRAAADQK
jgi:hypothetical protein